MDTCETLAEICLKAAEIMSSRGLAKGRLVDNETGAVCNNGALLLAMDHPEEKITDEGAVIAGIKLTENLAAIGMIQRTILREQEAFPQAPWQYNDLDSTTIEDMILLLKHTAEKIRVSEIIVNLSPDGDMGIVQASSA